MIYSFGIGKAATIAYDIGEEEGKAVANGVGGRRAEEREREREKERE